MACCTMIHCGIHIWCVHITHQNEQHIQHSSTTAKRSTQRTPPMKHLMNSLPRTLFISPALPSYPCFLLSQWPASSRPTRKDMRNAGHTHTHTRNANSCAARLRLCVCACVCLRLCVWARCVGAVYLSWSAVVAGSLQISASINNTYIISCCSAIL